MLVPAILYKEQIEKEFWKLYYTEDMFYYTGCLAQWYPNIKDIPGDGDFDYAIVSTVPRLCPHHRRWVVHQNHKD